MMSMTFRTVQGGNFSWFGVASDSKNHNSLKIHDQSMGETLETIEDIWDSDFLKIYRVLVENENTRTDFKTIIKQINRVCRHLEIHVYDYQGGYLLIVDQGDL